MFFRKDMNPQRNFGRVEIICGSMFSGKTEELIRRLNRAKISGYKIIVFKHELDTRYNTDEIVSHNKNSIFSNPVASSEKILSFTDNYEVIGIDEAQFFDDGLVKVCKKLADSGKRVIIAGLDMDYSGNPFGPIPKLMASSENITKVHAICVDCGEDALYSNRKTKNKKQIQLGEKNEYKPLCRSCFNNIA